MMNKLLTALLSLVFACASHAAPASAQSIENLLQLTQAEAMVNNMYTSVEQIMRQQMRQATQGKPLDAEQQRVLDAMPAKFMAIVREEITWAKQKPLYVQLYRDTFEQEEIDGLIAFYRSPTGQAFINKMPVVMQKSMALAQTQMQSLMPKMQAAIEEAIAEVKAKRKQ